MDAPEKRDAVRLAEEVKAEILLTDCLSCKHNRIALIEKAGTGIRRMLEDARKSKCPEPKFTVNGFFTATFRPNVEISHKITPKVTLQLTPQVPGGVTEQVSEQVGEQVSEQVDEQVSILKFCSTPKQKQEILTLLGLRPAYLNFKRHIQPLVKEGFLEMTIPEKPRSSRQRYQKTDLGRKILAQWSRE